MTKKINYPFSRKILVELQLTQLKNQIFIFPTDTVYGIGCRADDDKTVQKIFTIKKRDLTKPLLVVIDSLSMLKRYVHIEIKAVWNFLQAIWPNKCSVILPIKQNSPLSRFLNINSLNIAFRMINTPVAVALIKIAQVPLVATSANIHQLDTGNEIKNMEPLLEGNRINYIFNANKTSNLSASTVLDLSSLKCIRVLREGALGKTDLIKIVELKQIPLTLV